MLLLLLISSWKDNYGWTVVFKVNKSEYMDSENGIMNFMGNTSILIYTFNKNVFSVLSTAAFLLKLFT